MLGAAVSRLQPTLLRQAFSGTSTSLRSRLTAREPSTYHPVRTFMSSAGTKRMAATKIGTHDGSFHCDEAGPADMTPRPLSSSTRAVVAVRVSKCVLSWRLRLLAAASQLRRGIEEKVSATYSSLYY
jgi:hypothetical protein